MTEPDLEVRSIRPDEVDAAVEVWLAANAARGVASPEQHLDIVRGQLTTSTDVALVCVRQDDMIVGFVTGESRRVTGTTVDGAMQLLSIFVAPTAQGTGVGSLLMTAFLDEAERRGRPEIHLWVRSENDGARRLYERYGFRADAEEVMDGDVSITSYVWRPD